MAAKRKKVPAQPPPDWGPLVIEGYHRLPPKQILHRDAVHLSSTPTVGNGEARVRRYRLTLEAIDEPSEVISARIQALWDGSAGTNPHHWGPLRHEAARVSLELTSATRGREGKP